jgi:hypothetical protein
LPRAYSKVKAPFFQDKKLFCTDRKLKAFIFPTPSSFVSKNKQGHNVRPSYDLREPSEKQPMNELGVHFQEGLPLPGMGRYSGETLK